MHLENTAADLRTVLAIVDDAIKNRAKHLVFSGDVLHAANLEFLETFLLKLRDRNFSSTSNLTIVPGNHDIYPLSWPPRIGQLLRIPGKTAQRNFERFVQLTAKARLGRASKELFPNAPYPFVKVLSDEVVVVGLDTTRNNKWAPLSWAAGELPQETMAVVKKYYRAPLKTMFLRGL